MTNFIAVDIGGTRMRAASYADESLTPIKINRVKTHKKNSPTPERLKNLISSVWPDEGDVAAIGIAVPGPVNCAKGIIETAPNVPEFSGFAIVRYLQEAFNEVPVFLGNDANLAALGEWKFGAGRGHRYMLYLTISTGIGSGVILDGKLFSGAHGYASELGHVMAESNGPVCSCGIPGHLEAVASGTGIAKWVAGQIEKGVETSIIPETDDSGLISGAAIAKAAHQGDGLAIEAYRRAGRYLGQALADFLHIFNPTIIVLGGGVSQSFDLFADDLRATLKASLMIPNFADDLTFALAELGDDIGLMGALALARESTC